VRRTLRIRGVGLALVALSLPGLIRLAILPSATLAGLSAACLLAVALAARWCRRQASRIRLERQHPSEVRGRQSFQVQVLVGLEGKRPITGLLLGDDFWIGHASGGSSFYIPALAPDQKLCCAYRGVCTSSRGWQKLSQAVLTLEDPLGLVSLTVTRKLVSELLVLPETRELAAARLVNPPARSGDEDHRAQEAGAGDEFSGTREWRPGDRYRDIHWRSSARSGELVVREHSRTVRPDLVVLVHLHRPAPWSGAAGRSRWILGGGPWRLPRLQREPKPALLSSRAIDLCIEAAGSVVEWGPLAGYRTSLILGALQPQILEAIADTEAVLNALRLLAVAEPQSTTELEGWIALMYGRIPPGSVVVVAAPVTALLRAEAREALVGLSGQGHRVELLLSYPVADRSSGWDDPSEELAMAGLGTVLLSSAEDIGRILAAGRAGSPGRWTTQELPRRNPV
jgi:uncharacterized protein (DUF58 family)